MDSYISSFLLGAAAGAAIAVAGLYVGYRLGRHAAITDDGINQARVRDRIVQEPFIFKLGARPIKPR